MLARSFLTAKQLNLTKVEHSALVTVLGMLERKEIKAGAFNMWTTGFGEPDCGSPACMCGWARHVAGDGSIFSHFGGNRWLCTLFLMSGRQRDLPVDSNISMEQAAHALSNYLTTGMPNWRQVQGKETSAIVSEMSI